MPARDERINRTVKAALEARGVEFTRRLGNGAFSEAWAARWHDIERAVKISLEPINESLAVRKELDALDSVVKQLTAHRSIVSLIEYWVEQVAIDNQQKSFLVTIWELGSDSLEKHRQSISQDALLTYLEDIAEAIDYLHANGVHHRDVKPHNILLFDEDGHARLGDLGLARLVQLSTPTSLAGTPGFMAPEVLVPPYHSHPTADLYSLSISYVWMRAGICPSPLESFDQQAAIEGLSLAESRAIAAVIQRNPDLRPVGGARRWVDALRAAIEECLEPSSTIVPGETPAVIPRPAASELLARLEKLQPPELLDRLMFLVDMPEANQPSQVLTPGNRALALVKWAKSDGGCGLDRLTAELKRLLRGNV